MANKMSEPPIVGNVHLLQHQQHQRKIQNGSPKRQKHPMSSITQIANGTSDVVSDESEDAGNDGDSSSVEDDDEEDDEPDVKALSGSARRRIKAVASPLLAGLSRRFSDASDDDFAMAGAEIDLNNESDDATYQAAANVSDDDSGVDEEDVVLASAEQELIAEFELERPDTANAVTSEMIEMTIAEEVAPTTQPDLPTDGSQEEFVDLDWHADPFGGLNAADDIYQATRWDAEAEYWDTQLANWRIEREASAPLATQKKVRFEDTASSRASSTSSEEDPRDLFPDLFDDVNVMTVQHHIAISDAGAEMATDNESVFEYDFEDEQEKAEFEGDDDSESDSDASDSESDLGDSTDEETPEEQLRRVQQIKASKKGLVPALGPLPVIPRTPAASKKNSPNVSRSNSIAASSKLTTPRTAGKPRTGTFAHDPTRASITAGARGSGVKLVCPTKPPAEDREYWERARRAMSSRDGSPGGSVSWYRATPRTASIPQRPFTAKSTLGTMFDGNLDFLHSNDEHGIAKELLRSSRKNSMQSSFTSNSLTNAEVTDESSNVNMADFVQMDESDSDMEEDNMNLTTPSQRDFFSDSMLQSSPVRDRAAGLLDHFDQQRGLVSSFRNNQHIARHVSSLPANPARRAQLSEANALQQGRRAAANTPMTPARKKRQDLDNTGAGIKKTASPLVQKHRRSRGSSLSGIQLDRLAGNAQ